MNEEVLLRFLTQKSTSQDIHEIDKWISADPENAKWLFEMEKIWSLKDELKFSERKEIEKAFSTFLANTGQTEEKTKNTKWLSLTYWKYAAAVVILFLLSVNVYKIVFTDDNVNYSIENNINVNEIEVPKGQNITLKLSDGTKVWLNADSKFIYPSKFSAKNRIVKIIGEGYFEVEHSAESPFIVQSGSVSTTVLGTKFNVKAYQGEAIIVSLLEGIVEVSDNSNLSNKVRLNKPNDKAQVSETGLISKSSINAQALTQWISGELYFENEPLKNIATTLERKFNVKIRIQDTALESIVFNSRIQKDANLNDILNILKETRKLDYKIENDHVYLFR